MAIALQPNWERKQLARYQRRQIVIDAYGDDALCVYCGGEYESDDHVTPRNKGGMTHITNMVPACIRCNSIKGNEIPERFFKKYPRWAWNFARHAIHARKADREAARYHGQVYAKRVGKGRRSFFDGAYRE